MNEFNQKHAYDNFDKEFNRSGRRKNSGTGKFPRWGFGVLAGILLVGVGVFRSHTAQTKPAPAAMSAESPANYILPTAEEKVSAQTAVMNISNGDEQADSDEFAAVMASKTGKSIVLPSDTVYTLQDKNYSVSIEELPVNGSGEAVIAKNGTEDSSSAGNDSVVVWIDRTPFQLHFEEMADIPAGDIQSAESLPVIQIEGHPYALHMESSASNSTGEPVFNLDEQPITISVEDLENKSSANGNWFVQIFNSIFGESEPTAAPTLIPVTVIAEATATMTEVPTTEPTTKSTTEPTIAPTATAEILPTEPPEDKGPVRLDAKLLESDLADAPLYDDSEDEDADTSLNQTASQPSDAVAEQASGTAIPVYTENTASDTDGSLQPVVLRTLESDAPLSEPAEELPETGMAEDWNIPMLLTAVAGLLFIIILARRLRNRG